MRTLVVFAAVLAVALADGGYYVPRAYYTIDSAGHESIPIPLQRLRRSYNPAPAPQPYPGSWSDSSSGANAWSKSNSGSGGGGWAPPAPPGGYGASAPSGGHVYGTSGTFGPSLRFGASPEGGHFVSSSSSINVDPTGYGRYQTSVGTYP